MHFYCNGTKNCLPICFIYIILHGVISWINNTNNISLKIPWTDYIYKTGCTRIITLQVSFQVNTFHITHFVVQRVTKNHIFLYSHTWSLLSSSQMSLHVTNWLYESHIFCGCLCYYWFKKLLGSKPFQS